MKNTQKKAKKATLLDSQSERQLSRSRTRRLSSRMSYSVMVRPLRDATRGWDQATPPNGWAAPPRRASNHAQSRAIRKGFRRVFGRVWRRIVDIAQSVQIGQSAGSAAISAGLDAGLDPLSSRFCCSRMTWKGLSPLKLIGDWSGLPAGGGGGLKRASASLENSAFDRLLVLACSSKRFLTVENANLKPIVQSFCASCDMASLSVIDKTRLSSSKATPCGTF